MTRTYTHLERDAARLTGDVTPNGVAFDYWFVGAIGARFCLLREPHHTQADIEQAAAHLYHRRDVVGRVRVARVVR